MLFPHQWKRGETMPCRGRGGLPLRGPEICDEERGWGRKSGKTVRKRKQETVAVKKGPRRGVPASNSREKGRGEKQGGKAKDLGRE